jgi:hypothetical protein
MKKKEEKLSDKLGHMETLLKKLEKRESLLVKHESMLNKPRKSHTKDF